MYLHSEDKQEVLESSVKIDSGICLTCNNSKDCVFNKDLKKAIFFCNEFDSFVNLNGSTRFNNITDKIDIQNKKIYNNTLKGLCVNCEHSMSCEYAKELGGVWHCEEYS